jgi:hypothetical protein
MHNADPGDRMSRQRLGIAFHHAQRQWSEPGDRVASVMRPSVA